MRDQPAAEKINTVLSLPAQFGQFICGFDSRVSLNKDLWRLAERMVTADVQLPVSEPAVLTA